ncbi:MAG: molybdopterin-dependent oxidoreductase [Bacteroidetes bacterium]|nr:molybdopterin-dependent oxidoreductase [Rhodothermia bacterium]MCS7155782.1 molybdopterin-dependent oxidoreductase [Bacteroidota bacterium]MCX7906117.1 molybdopterin-dependent oxidoreductase [Bacteroidota bacterium]MDW8138245.1 molybdopterin-dependent oxidoreductase [Bacteroidota bacterium]MDW8285929.1 molybdopterin-dependent oxidoreductase [Bacteroidota bacterium]
MKPLHLESPTLRRPAPPGQRYIDTFPIYDITPNRPRFDPSSYRLRIWGACDNPFELSWEAFKGLPRVEVVADFHCVTGWSKRALRWEGVPVRLILERAQPWPGAVQVMAHGLEGYTTNVPLEYLWEEDALLADTLNGAPLSPEHGAPVRLLVPQLYAWKSAKYLCGLELQTEMQAGFWEERGYHLIGDPWQEQRYGEPLERVRSAWRQRISRLERPSKGQ